jgi:hypothetical protein
MRLRGVALWKTIKPRYLLAELKKTHPTIACVHVIKGEYQESKAFEINTKNTADKEPVHAGNHNSPVKTI